MAKQVPKCPKCNWKAREITGTTVTYKCGSVGEIDEPLTEQSDKCKKRCAPKPAKMYKMLAQVDKGGPQTECDVAIPAGKGVEAAAAQAVRLCLAGGWWAYTLRTDKGTYVYGDYRDKDGNFSPFNKKKRKKPDKGPMLFEVE
jgi:hypothetical protein